MRFQFSIRSLLLATCWLSIALGSFSALRHLNTSDFAGWNQKLATAVVFALIIISLTTPLLAVRQLLGWHRESGPTFWAIAGMWCIVWLIITLSVMQ